MAQPTTPMKRKLTPAEREHIAEALALLAEADTNSVEQIIDDEDGEDARIDTVVTLTSVLGEYIDRTIGYIGQDADAAIAQAKGVYDDLQANQNMRSNLYIETARVEINRLYTAALHAQATSYFVDSHQGYEDVLKRRHIDEAVKFANPGNDLYTFDDYNRALLDLIKYFDVNHGMN